MKNVIKKAIAFLVVFILVIPMFNGVTFAMDNGREQEEEAIEAVLAENEAPKGSLLGTTQTDVAYKEYDSPGSYLTWHHDCEVLTSDNGNWKGWLVAYGNITISKRVEVNESVHLILADGCTLTCQKGIEVETSWTIGKDDAELTIYAQSTGENMGRLIATGDGDRAGIGSGSCLIDLDGDISGTIYIHGGYIEAVGGSFGAGIGGGNAASGADVTIYGGEVHAQGGLQSAGIGGGAEGTTGSGGEGGNLTVYGGIVEAIGYREFDQRSSGAGIGGGNDGDGGTVTIYDGTVTAIGGYLAAGIGGGSGGKGGSLTVYGGSVTATGGECITHSLQADKFGGAGIGGGNEKDGGTVTVYNGIVTATGTDGGAGIGGGGGSLEADSKAGGDGGTVTVYNGTITATGNDGGAGIGGGSRANGGAITLYGGTFDIKNNYMGKALGRGYGGGSDGSIDVGVGSSVFDADGTRINGGFNPKSWGACGYFFDDNLIKQFSVRTYGDPVTYHAYDLVYGENQYECKKYTFINKNVKKWENGWYVVDDGGTIEDVVTVTGDVHLIIEDGQKLVTRKGIRVEKGASLSVHAQSDGENHGCLIVNGANYCAGIGGGDGKAGGAFTLHSGEVEVYGGNSAAGIGGGRNGNGGLFTIYGGKLTVSSGAGASRAIGAGNGASDNGTVTVRESFNLYDADSKKTISKDSDSTSWASLLNETNYTLMLVRKEFVPGEPVSYLYYDNNLKLQSAECESYTRLTQDMRAMENGWYVLDQDITLDSDSTLSAFGDVHLILLNGATLTAYDGVCVNDGNSLTIYAQSEWEDEMGVLNAYGYYDYMNAGIGGAMGVDGGNITIDGGKITATGGENAAGIGGGEDGDCGNVVIHGGIVTASSIGSGAGIGTGMYECTYTTDNDGNVVLTDYGHNNGNITITGGIVKASAPDYGSGIGGGEGFEGGNITISGGTVMANGWNRGIGSGCFKIHGIEFSSVGEVPGGNVNITGGEITAESILVNGKAFLTDELLISEDMAVFVYNDDIKVLVENPEDYVSECKTRKKVELLGIHDHDLYGNYHDNGDGTHSRKCSICSKFIPEKHSYDDDGVCVFCGAALTEYYEYDVGTQNFVRKLMKEVPKKITSAKDDLTLPGGWYLIEGDVTIDGSLNFTGDVHIVLKDGCTLKVKKGIVGESGADLSFYAQSPASANPGKVIVPANDSANAGIGAKEKDSCGKITIHGGDFDVHGGLGAAGIGGSRNGSCGKITIYSGKINATGRTIPNGAGGGAGIGSGYYENAKYDGTKFTDYGITESIEGQVLFCV